MLDTLNPYVQSANREIYQKMREEYFRTLQILHNFYILLLILCTQRDMLKSVMQIYKPSDTVLNLMHKFTDGINLCINVAIEQDLTKPEVALIKNLEYRIQIFSFNFYIQHNHLSVKANEFYLLFLMFWQRCLVYLTESPITKIIYSF